MRADKLNHPTDLTYPAYHAYPAVVD